jgi:hypothetical protein
LVAKTFFGVLFSSETVRYFEVQAPRPFSLPCQAEAPLAQRHPSPTNQFHANSAPHDCGLSSKLPRCSQAPILSAHPIAKISAGATSRSQLRPGSSAQSTRAVVLKQTSGESPPSPTPSSRPICLPVESSYQPARCGRWHLTHGRGCRLCICAQLQYWRRPTTNARPLFLHDRGHRSTRLRSISPLQPPATATQDGQSFFLWQHTALAPRRFPVNGAHNMWPCRGVASMSSWDDGWPHQSARHDYGCSITSRDDSRASSQAAAT